MQYQPTIGLEIHVELATKSKMFCSCPNDSGERRPNTLVCPICMGHPGTLPVINEEAVKKVIKTGLVLNCQIPEYSAFDRKSYFYPDLPKGYQISQEYLPLCRGGYLEIAGRKIGIRNIHLEEDVGKLVHEKDYSLVDFNRAGVPLMELVTEPDIGSAQEARKFAEELRLILRYLGVSDADMEKGQMRVEVNISLQRKSQIPCVGTVGNPKSKTPSSRAKLPEGEQAPYGAGTTGQANSKSQNQNSKLGTKVEIKNLNSFRSVEGVIEHEIARQAKLLEAGKKIIQETRGWDESRAITKSQRTKEEAHDYRYFPEPDLPPLHLGVPEYLSKIRAEIPELPRQKQERFKEEYRLGDREIEVFVQNKGLGEYYEKVVSELRNWVKESELKEKVKESEFFGLAKLASNYILTDLQGLIKASAADKLLITPENFAEFLTLIYRKEISSKIAKAVLLEMFTTGADPSQIIEDKGFSQITDESEIEKAVKEVISRNQKAVGDYRKGKATALQFLIGQVMQRSRGRANPELVRQILLTELE